MKFSVIATEETIRQPLNERKVMHRGSLRLGHDLVSDLYCDCRTGRELGIGMPR